MAYPKGEVPGPGALGDAEEAAEDRLDPLLEEIIPATTAGEVARAEGPLGLGTAVLVARDGAVWKVRVGGRGEAVVAEVADDVEGELLGQVLGSGGRVLVEQMAGAPPLIVGVLQTRVAREVVVKGTTVTIEAEREVLLRAGRAALRLREDGDVELVGTRISAASRGLFRLVGRILRLN